MKWLAAALLGLAALAAAVVLRTRAPASEHGLHLVYATDRDAARAAEVVQRRLELFGVTAHAAAERGRIAVDLPGPIDEDRVAQIKDLLARHGHFELRVVDDCDMPALEGCIAGGNHTGSPMMRRIAFELRDHPVGEIAMHLDQWSPPDGMRHNDYSLEARDRAQIVHYVQELAAADPTFALPDDRELAFERTRTGWRSYYVEREARLNGSAVENAWVKRQDELNVVEVELTRAAAIAFEELTRARVGMKLAMTVDDTVYSAPVIMGTIAGGKLQITVGDGQDADELATVLHAGALPAPLRLESVAAY